jgi:hypothetical protein
VVLDRLSKKLAKAFSTEEQVDEYLMFVLNEINDLNKFFARKNRAPVPYSRLFAFANKDERLSSFLFDSGVKKKFFNNEEESSGIDVAGFNSSQVKDDDVTIIYKDDVYGCVYVSSKRTFFFSSAVNRLIVQKHSNGKILQYKKYVHRMNSKGKKFISPSQIFSSVVKKKKINSSSLAFKSSYDKFLSGIEKRMK